MYNLYVFDRVLGMSNFMHKLVSIDIHVMYAVRHLVERVTSYHTNVYIVVSAHIAVMCAGRHST
jgi:hypothetical protein